ncbi:cytochrome-c peroxidase [Mesorhizobium sp. J8]|uniref:cytochrome-c peroxidase n=1 Tax=Mesorhizobium sp. J8 TaxID=2777475 RepID=UPI001934BE07|nr:cytochrome-c peroxidase [Mesorhizobium sp. J8]BCM17541.1 cytochrome-c peroxidase [Mesorhizobium sp. J8]
MVPTIAAYLASLRSAFTAERFTVNTFLTLFFRLAAGCMTFPCAALMCFLLASEAMGQDNLLDVARSLFRPIPKRGAGLDPNPATSDKLELGKMIFFEPRISKAHNISCNTCHQIGRGGADGRSTSIGHNWQRGDRNAPTVLNAVFNIAQFWDGRAADLKEQASGPIVNPIEMGTSPERAVAELKGIPGYVEAFGKAFPDEINPLNYDNIAEAIAAFEATLITPNAPFDRYLEGDENALTNEQKEGLRLFVNRGCSSCHNGINVGGGMYAPFGVVEKPGWEFLPPDDKGRIEVTRKVDDEYVFKVPTLRNVALTAPYFHSGHSWDLDQAVAVMGTTQLGTQLKPEEVDNIVAFLLALTGDQPQVVYPILPPSVVTTPRPAP